MQEQLLRWPAVGTVVSIVEDNPTVRDSLVILLEAMGYTVRAYASGEPFLTDHDDSAATALVLDVHLPGVDAFGVLESLARRGTRMPATVLITGQSDPAIERKAAERGIRLLDKPVDGHALIEALEQARRQPD